MLRSTARLIVLLMMAASASLPQPSIAQTVNWNVTNGTFSVPANWLGGVAPGAGSIALFNTAGGFYSCTFSSNATIAGLTCNDPGLTFRSTTAAQKLLTVSGLTLVQDDLNLNKLDLTSGTLSIMNGALLTTFGDSAVNIGTLLMTDAGGGQLQLFGGSLTSSLNITSAANHFVGQNGGLAVLRCSDTVGSIAGTLNLSVSGVAGTTSQFLVDGPSSMSVAHLNIGTGTAVGQLAQMLVDTGSTVTQTGASFTRIGSNLNSVASFDVQGGTFSTGTGSFIVNPTGVASIAFGRFLSNGDVSIAGGKMLIDSGTFTLASSKTLSVTSNGTFQSNTTSLAVGASTIAVSSGGKFSTDSPLNLPASALLSVSGAGSAGTFAGGTLNPAAGSATIQVSSGGSLMVINDLLLGSATSGAGGQGRLEVLAAGIGTLSGLLRVGDRNSSTRTGVVLVDGPGSTLTHQGDALLLGASGLSAGTIIVSNSGAMSSGVSSPNPSTIGTTGRLILNGGSFTLHNDLQMDPGSQIIATNVAAQAGLLTVLPGADITSFNGTISLANSLAVDGASHLTSGGSTSSFSTSGALNVGNTGTGAPIVEISSSGRFTAADVNLATTNSGADPTLGLFSQATGTITSGLSIGTGTNAASAALAVIDSATLRLTGGTSAIGSASGASGTLQVASGGVFESTIASPTLAAKGTLRLINATFKAPNIVDAGGTILFDAGTLQLTAGTMTVGNSSLLPTLFTLGPSHYLDVTTTSIENGAVLNLAGGTLRSGSLSNTGYLNWTSGTVELTASGATVGPSSPLGLLFSLDPLKTLKINGNLSVATGGEFSFVGGQLIGAGSLANSGVVLFDVSGYVPFTGNLVNGINGTIFVGDRAVISVDSQIVNAGRIQLDGGAARIAGAGSIVNNGGVITGDGYIAIPVQNAGFGEIRGEAGKTLVINSFALTNDARIRLLGGTVEYVQGLTNNPLGRIEGHGIFKAATLSNSGTITLSAGLSDFIGTLTNNASGKVIVTGGGTATFYNNVTNLAGSEFRVSAGSTAAFLANVTGTTSFTGSGVKIFESTATPGPLVTSGSTIVEAGANVVVPAIRETSLTVYGSMTILPDGSTAATSRLHTLTIDGGTLDLNDNDLVIDYTGTSPVNDIRSYLSSGVLFSSVANSSTSPKFAIGYMENSTGLSIFSGQEVDSTSLLLAYTLSGDSNLDGKVNTIDFNNLAGSFGQVSRFWVQGDFNYDGTVNSVDFNQLTANYGHSTVVGAAPALGALLPEPGLSVILFLAWPVMRRRC